ncbi:secretin and TonB N-terminal domain-containing protein [Nitrosomonas sp. Nm166]|uniref:secretin and TonB N-terminal domain-containing protein n=1 Tax=Nitrosomonas sp. Nm166 TaxID=1881054 RepID=UPI0008DFE109|nr:secretin and TonB N-terminal domain-containing protein [Nitrosomonas sp. Nm166]SFE59010.1 general secretion pathway protein D [Nitrosomonas sp. Nm166]
MKRWRIIALSILLAVTMGCAIDNRSFLTRNIAFSDSQKLVAEGKLEKGLEKLEQAAREEPENKEIRTMLMRLRDQVLGKLLIEADNLRYAGDLDQAEQGYQRVLSMYPFNERAKEGIEALKTERRHIASVESARALLARNDLAKAETLVRAILQENPQQSHARQLISEINSHLSRPEVTHLALESAFKKALTMEFKDTDLKSVFEIMARTAGINFVFDKDIRQDAKISIFVRNNTIEDILKLLLTTNQLAYKVLNNNSLLIYPNTPAKQKDYQELVVRSFQVAHTDVKQMVAMVRGIVKAKDIYVNEQLNLFIMRDTLEAIRLTERLVTLNDLAEPEVMLDVVILDIARNNDFLLGPKFPQSITYGAAGVTAATATTTAGVTPGLVLLNQVGFDGLKSFAVDSRAVIDFLHNLSTGDVLANPRIRVANREKAKIHVGEKRPFFTANVQPGITAVVTSTPTFIDLGVKLDVEPRVGVNSDVTMKITLEVSSRISDITGPSNATAPLIGTRNAETMLTLKDGETQVLAGLIDNRETRSISGLAGLLNIPGLDRLTSNQKINRTKNEIVLLITPRIIRNIPKPSNLESEYHFGTASEAGKLPIAIQRTAAQSLAIAPSGPVQGTARTVSDAFAPSADQQAAPNPFANVSTTSPSLTIQAPTNVGLDKEFSVNVRLVGAKATVNADVQLNYEASVLEALDGGPKSGSRVLKLGKDQTAGLATQLRFKVIAANPGATEINIQSATAEDIEHGDSVDVTLPPPAAINIK